VVGIVAVLASLTIIGGILLGIVAVALGVIALVRVRRGLAAGRGLAIAGTACGALGLALSVLLLVVGIGILNSDSGKTLQQCLRQAGNDTAAQTQCQKDFQNDLRN
jgi:hypothetical protein